MKRTTNAVDRILTIFLTCEQWCITRYARLPQKIRQSVFPFVLASLPIVVSSVLGMYIVMPIVVVMSTGLILLLTNETDAAFFEMSKTDARKFITLPLCGFIGVWGILLVLMGRGSMMNGVVGPYCVVLLVACAPAYRWKAAQVKRYVPLWLSFGFAGVLAVSASFFYVNN
ncbi:hypothetical protein [Janthinobacterium sp. MDT1-19]|uniref:hypothetical protein n=1 Tax=Janthinobacterium sp. MDT1-19 TaxID=1259339 RepID=UPI003F20DFBE